MTATTTVSDEAGLSSSLQSSERTAGLVPVPTLGAPADEEVTIWQTPLVVASGLGVHLDLGCRPT